MPKFTIEHESSKNPQDAFGKIKDFLSNDGDMRRFDSKLQCSFDEASHTAQMKGSQFKADLNVTPSGTGCKVAVTVDLPLMLSPFRGKITETLKTKLLKYLG